MTSETTNQPEGQPREERFHLFGRKSYTEPLAYVRSVPVGELTGAAADRQDWIELIAFPEAAVIRVIPQGETP